MDFIDPGINPLIIAEMDNENAVFVVQLLCEDGGETISSVEVKVAHITFNLCFEGTDKAHIWLYALREP